MLKLVVVHHVTSRLSKVNELPELAFLRVITVD
jgi:hypothetical protein